MSSIQQIFFLLSIYRFNRPIFQVIPWRHRIRSRRYYSRFRLCILNLRLRSPYIIYIMNNSWGIWPLWMILLSWAWLRVENVFQGWKRRNDARWRKRISRLKEILNKDCLWNKNNRKQKLRNICFHVEIIHKNDSKVIYTLFFTHLIFNSFLKKTTNIVFIANRNINWAWYGWNNINIDISIFVYLEMKKKRLIKIYSYPIVFS